MLKCTTASRSFSKSEIRVYNTLHQRNAEPTMKKTNFLKQLVTQLSEALPAHLGTLKTDFEKNCHAILSKAFTKFDLVTREEFDTQTKVLARTRKKLDELETQLKTLEKSLSGRSRHRDH